MKGLKIALKKGYKNDFISKFKPKLKGDDIFVGDKQIIPRSELQSFLEKQLKGESPTGIRSMQAYLSNNFVGVTRSTGPQVFFISGIISFKCFKLFLALALASG